MHAARLGAAPRAVPEIDLPIQTQRTRVDLRLLVIALDTTVLQEKADITIGKPVDSDAEAPLARFVKPSLEDAAAPDHLTVRHQCPPGLNKPTTNSVAWGRNRYSVPCTPPIMV